MESPDSPSGPLLDRGQLHTTSEPAQVAILADPRRARFLAPFLGRTRSVTEAARELSCSPNTMLYRVRRMTAAGLLRVEATVPRAGRPIAYYRATHDAWFVPMSAMNYLDLRHRVETHNQPLHERISTAYSRVLAAQTESGRAIGRDRDGRLWHTDLPPARDRRGRPVLMVDIVTHLTRDEAEHVRALLQRGLERAGQPSASPERTDTYLIHAVVMPTE